MVSQDMLGPRFQPSRTGGERGVVHETVMVRADQATLSPHSHVGLEPEGFLQLSLSCRRM